MKLPVLLLSAAAVVATGSPVLAQAPGPSRPYRGLFGSGTEQKGTGQRLDLMATLVQAFDDNLIAESRSPTPATPAVSGYFTMLQTGGAYQAGNRTVQLRLSGASAFRYYNQVGEIQSVSHAGAAGLSASLGARTSVRINQNARYSPSYLFGLFPEVADDGSEAASAAPDYAVHDLASRAYGTNARLTHDISNRTSVSMSGDYRFTDYLHEEAGRRDMTSYGARAEFSRQVARHTSLHMGYRYRTGDYATTEEGSASEQGVVVGVDHARVLSASRQANVGFNVGVSASDAPIDRVSGVRGRLYRVLGDATFSYPFGRSWQARARYRRGLEYIAELTEPVFVGGISATVDGLVTRRVDFFASAGYSNGQSAVRSTPRFDTYTVDVRSRWAIRPSVAVYLGYLFYVYDFGATGLLPTDVSPRLKRHGVRAGVTFWVPAF